MARFDYRLLLVSILALPLLALALPHAPAVSAGPSMKNSRGAAQASDSGPALDAAPRCPTKELLFNYEQDRFGHTWAVPIWHFHDSDAFFSPLE